MEPVTEIHIILFGIHYIVSMRIDEEIKFQLILTWKLRF